jgi:ATP-dependent Zn protease
MKLQEHHMMKLRSCWIKKLIFLFLFASFGSITASVRDITLGTICAAAGTLVTVGSQFLYNQVSDCFTDCYYFYDETSRLSTAYHEAGHALIGVLTGHRVYSTSIKVTISSLGLTKIEKFMGDKTKSDLMYEVMIDLAGPCAEEMRGKGMTVGSYDDIERANNRIKEIVCDFGMGDSDCSMALEDLFISEEMKEKYDRECVKTLNLCKNKVFALLRRYRKEHELLALALLEQEQLYEDEIYEILGEPRLDSFDF